MPCVITSVRVTIVLNLNLVLFFSILNLVDLQLILDLLSRENRVPTCRVGGGGGLKATVPARPHVKKYLGKEFKKDNPPPRRARRARGCISGGAGVRRRRYIRAIIRGAIFNNRTFLIGHNKWICGSECCMYVWERLHVHGRRISSRARRRRKFTVSYPF
jgi:hypothetical protein